MKFLIQGQFRTGFDGYGWTSDLVASDDETATFDTRADAEKGIDALVRLGWPRNELRIIEVDA